MKEIFNEKNFRVLSDIFLYSYIFEEYDSSNDQLANKSKYNEMNLDPEWWHSIVSFEEDQQ